MKLDKKAQAQIITTILIILLVLAAIVIVWQVVQGTIGKGAGEIGEQSTCLGISMEVSKVSNTEFSIMRRGGGTITPEPSIKVIADGATTTCTWSPANPDWTQDLESAICTLTPAPSTSVEAGLVLDDGTVCSITGKWEA